MTEEIEFEHIIFDLGLVLLDWNPRNLFVKHLGHNIEAVEQFLGEICTTEWHLQLDAGKSFNSAMAPLLDRYPQHRDWINTYHDAWPQMFAGQIDATVELLERLHAHGYRLHALSNYPGEQVRYLYDTYPFMRRFDSVVISGLLGVTKPDPQIYRSLLSTIDANGIKPNTKAAHRCLFIDDRVENCVAAAKEGIQTIHFTPESGLEQLTQIVDRCCGVSVA